MTPTAFTRAAERTAAAALTPNPLAPFAGLPDGHYAAAVDAFDALLLDINPADLHPVEAPRVAERLAALLPDTPQAALLAFVREELLHAANADGTLADPVARNRLAALTLQRFA